MNSIDLFIEAARRHPDKVAILHKGRQITFGELKKDVEKTITYFRAKGLQEGDRVLVFVPMSIDLYRVVLALFAMGATAVFLDEWVSKKRMEMCCEIAQCKGFIGVRKARILRWFSKELRRIPLHLKLGKKGSTTSTVQSFDPDTPALITFTTGSTGRPKAANRTHGFLVEQFKALVDEIEPREEDIDMPVLPIVLFMNLGVGCSSFIPEFSMLKPQKANFEGIVQEMLGNNVNRCTASPYFVDQLAKYCLDKNLDLSLDKLFTGGAPVFPSMAKIYQKAFPSTEINIVYGSTEAEPISSISAIQLLEETSFEEKGLAVGQPYKGTAVKIIQIKNDHLHELTPKEFTAIQLQEGELGEIIVSGEHVLKHYFNSQEAFQKSKILVDGELWHRTGDSGFLKQQGLYLCGRCAQLIHWEEQTLSPFIIEDLLLQIEGINLGTLLKINEELVLVVESSSRINEKQLRNIPHHRVIQLQSIPRDPRHRSKIDYEQLKELIA